MQYLRRALELHADSGSASMACLVRVSLKSLLSLSNRLIVVLHQRFVFKSGLHGRFLTKNGRKDEPMKWQRELQRLDFPIVLQNYKKDHNLNTHQYIRISNSVTINSGFQMFS